MQAIVGVSLYHSVLPQQHAKVVLVKERTQNREKERKAAETVNFSSSHTASSTNEIISSLLFPQVKHLHRGDNEISTTTNT
jgi:hypothetical protein